jgi:hypothetical protein
MCTDNKKEQTEQCTIHGVMRWLATTEFGKYTITKIYCR